MSKRPFRFKSKPNRQLSPAKRAEIKAQNKRLAEEAVVDSQVEKEPRTTCFLSKPYPEELLKPLHVDDFLDAVKFITSHPELNYVHFMLTYFRMPAIDRIKSSDFMDGFKLFVSYEGKRWRVTGASRFGDVWLAERLNQDHGYDRRVDLDFSKLTNWHHSP